MKIKTSELIGKALNWAVRRALWPTTEFVGYVEARDNFSTCWNKGGPVLTEAHISRTIDHSGLWIAYDGFNYADAREHMQCDRSELVAGLRCFVASKLGDEVDVPQELCA